MNHWYIRVKDGKNFKNSSPFNIYGLKSWYSLTKNFMKLAQEGDILWFVTNIKLDNLVIACANFERTKKRELGPLINLDMTDKDLGWQKNNKDIWDTELHYKNLYNIEDISLKLKGLPPLCTIGKINNNEIEEKLNNEFRNIIKYSKIKFSF